MKNKTEYDLPFVELPSDFLALVQVKIFSGIKKKLSRIMRGEKPILRIPLWGGTEIDIRFLPK